MFLISSAGYLLCLFVVVFTLSKLRLANGLGSPGPYWNIFLFQLPISVLPVIVFAHGFNNNVRSYYNIIPDSELIVATMWLIYGVILFCFSFVLFEKLFGVYKSSKVNDQDSLVFISVILTVLVLISIVYLKAGDLPILHLGSSYVNIARKDIGAYSNYYSSMIQVVSFFGMAYAGSVERNKHCNAKYVMILFCCVGLLWQGSKGPILSGLLTFVFSFYFFHGLRLNFKKIILIIVFCLIGVWGLYKVTMPDLSGDELVNRVFGRLLVSQMEGYYRALAFSTPDAKYIANWIPFSGALGFNEVSFTKQLMIDTYGDSLTSGHMNSFFMQEAWGVIGTLGLIVSPLIVAFSITVSLRLIRFSLHRIAGPRFIISCFYSYLAVVSITGGFAQFPFFRGAIIAIVYFLTLAIIVRFFSQLFKMR